MADEFRVELTADNQISDEARDAAAALDAIPTEVETRLEVEASGVDKAVGKLDLLAQEAASAAIAAEALGQALGPELAGRADMRNVIAELEKLGLTADEVTADVDRVAAKLREIDSPDLGGGLGQALGTARGETEKLADSARGANSALANVVGNSAQELGALGGVVGPLGLAFGQMGEYATDAALGGERVKSALASMAAVLGPVLAITAALSAAGGAVEANKRRTEQAAETAERFGEAMEGAADDALGLADSLRENDDAMRDFDASTALLGDLGTVINDAGKAIPLLGRLFQDTSVDIVSALADSGNSLYEFTSAIEGGASGRAAFVEELGYLRDAGLISSDQFAALAQATEEYGVAADQAAAAQQLFNVNATEANAILSELAAKADPLSQMADTWRVLFDDMADGSIDTRAAADAINELAEGLGLTEEQVIDLARGKLDEQLEADARAAEDAAEAARDYAIALAETKSQLGELGSEFAQIGLRGDALSAVFDLGNAPRDAAGQVRDIAIAIGELSEAAADVSADQILSGDIGADAILDQLDALRPEIQGKITEAFSAGGPEAGIAMANSYIDQVTAELGGKLSREQVADLLNLSNIEATVAVALELSSVESAKRQLDILTGIRGETPYSASIKLALDAGTITGEQAQTLIQNALGQEGVPIPTSLQAPTTADAIAAANAQLASGAPVAVPTAADLSGVTGELDEFAATEQAPAVVPVETDLAPAEGEVDEFVSADRSTDPVTVDASTAAAAAVLLAFLTLPRKANIYADVPNAGAAMAVLAAIASAPRTAYVDVRPGTISLPTSADLAARIGPVRVPIDLYVRTSPRLDGG